MGEKAEGLKRAVIGLVEGFESDAELKNSLQAKTPTGARSLRQVDLRGSADGPILFKVFIGWDWEVNMWHAYVEGPQEICFEDGESNLLGKLLASHWSLASLALHRGATYRGGALRLPL